MVVRVLSADRDEVSIVRVPPWIRMVPPSLPLVTTRAGSVSFRGENTRCWSHSVFPTYKLLCFAPKADRTPRGWCRLRRADWRAAADQHGCPQTSLDDDGGMRVACIPCGSWNTGDHRGSKTPPSRQLLL